MQATGRDARGRKQYRYHWRWNAVRDEAKYEHMLKFARILPRIRRRVARDLRRPGLPREKVLATVVRLLEMTLIRVGNEEYARQNGSFGLSTFQNRHAEVSGERIRFQFRGKSGKRHAIELADARVARIVKRCQDLPGQDLFECLDENEQMHNIGSADVNAYLQEISGEEVTAKDFRTWAGTVLAAIALRDFPECHSGTRAKRNIVRAVEDVAERLGNTVAVCRKCYVHPAIFEAYLDGTTIDAFGDKVAQTFRRSSKLHAEEAAVLGLLRQRLRKAA